MITPVRTPQSRSSHARASHRLRTLAIVLVWLAALVAVPGFMLRSTILLSAATCLIGIALALGDLAYIKQGKVEPITLFAFSLGVTGFANAVGLASANSTGTSPYFIYAADDHLLLASLLLLVGGITTVIGFRILGSMRTCRLLIGMLPPIRNRMSDHALVLGGAIVGSIGIMANFFPGRLGTGTVSAVILLAPNLVAFTLARVGAARRLHQATTVALLVALAEATRAALFSYLRSAIIIPLFAFTLGLMVGRRSVAALRMRYLVPVYVAIVIFVVFFATLGRARVVAGGGAARVAAVMKESQDVDQQPGDRQALLVRLTSFNQLSQIGRLVEQDGFLHGATLGYLGYAFVPRFLWPEKPKIAKGAWFAYRIGEAYLKPDGSYSNSINMTVPGELYLNFGWPGVVIGCVLFGAILRALWVTTNFWADSRNAFGNAFGFYLLWVSFGLGADLQIVVTLIATYLIFVAATIAVRIIAPLGQPSRSARSVLATISDARPVA